MAGAIASLRASLRWDLDDFDRGTNHIETTFNGLKAMAVGLGEAFAAAGRRMTAGITLPLAGFAGFAIKATSDAQELQSAFDYTFGEMADRMNIWAEESGDAMGRSTQAMQEGAMAFGLLFNQAAPTKAAAADMSQSFTELAQDASSFFNVPFDDAFQRMRSGLVGEAEPLRKFGIFLSEAAVEAKALELGLIKEGQELNENGKIMARATLIAEGLADAKGDVERTSGSLANRVRALKENFHELMVEMGERLLPIAETVVGVARKVVDWFGSLSGGTKDLIVKMALFAMAIGPVMMIVSKLAMVVLPFFLLSLGPLGIAIVALVNPLGALVIVAVKAFSAMGGLAGLISRIAPFFLRLLGPIGLAISAVIYFRDEIFGALKKVWETAKEYLGPKLEALFEVFGRMGTALDGLMDGPLGDLMDWIGEFVAFMVEAWGTVLVGIVGVLIDVATFIGDMVATWFEVLSGFFEVIGLLISGDWAGAWDLAQQVIGDAFVKVAEWIKWLSPQLSAILTLIGNALGAGERAAAKAGGAGDVGREGGAPWWQVAADPRVTTDYGAGDYAIPDTPKPDKPSSTRKRTGRAGRRGPSPEELAARREELRIEHEMELARERGDMDTIRALERQEELRRKIEDYKRAGLNTTQATAAAERDMAELDLVRLDARDEALIRSHQEYDLEVARLHLDWEEVDALERENFLQDRIVQLQREGWSLTAAQAIAQDDLLRIEEARTVNAEKRLAIQEEERQIELARLRGDDDASIRAMEERQRMRDRADELVADFGKSRAEAETIAMREASDRSRAYVQGNFRAAFRDGLRAALDGDLKGFVSRWFEDATFNALAKVLDRLADRLADLVFDQRSGGGGLGGVFGAIGGLFGIGGGGGGGLGSAASNAGGAFASAGSALKNLPGFSTSGRFTVRGFSGLDANLLSLNGNPVARVDTGEIVDIHRGEGGRGGGKLVVEVMAGDGFDARVRNVSGDVVAESAPALMEGASKVSNKRAAWRQSRRLG